MAILLIIFWAVCFAEFEMLFTNDENTVTYLPVYQCTIVCSIRSLSVSEVAAIRRSISMHLTFYFELNSQCIAHMTVVHY
ncbi:hypothetical protein T05_13364 [Trichinella murrelli]|uniref:Uncharacterized protein n=1 Tax=Trichinella murrelli TaxID=144512 RepID=A0A0V0UEJ9_9BILA|nr:hypothetical protein T05_13364 [Trichinella murrelli]